MNSIRRRVMWMSVLATLMVGTAAVPSRGVSSSSKAGSETSAVQTYRVQGVSTKETRTEVARTGAAIEAIGPDFVLVRALAYEIAAIQSLGYQVSVLPQDDFPSEDARFHNYDEMVADVTAVAAAHPDIVSMFSIGKTYRGRDIWAAKISDNVAIDEDEPEVLFDAAHHAREHLTVEMTLFILHLFADNYGQVQQITKLVDTREIFVIFIVNADGAEYDIQNDFYHYWRKNRQPNPPTQWIGTDNNRNYDYRWDCCGGSSDDPASDTYHGAAPFSTPESAALAAFVDSRVIGGVEQITSHISYHTYSQLILWPYGYTFENIPPDMDPVDHQVFVTMGEAMAATTCKPDCFTPEQSSDLYITDGTTTDWMYGAHRIFSFTFELYPACCDFYVEDEVIGQQTKRLRSSVLYLVRHADCPYEVIGQSCS